MLASPHLPGSRAEFRCEAVSGLGEVSYLWTFNMTDITRLEQFANREIEPGCALIGRDPTFLRSHWSRDIFIVMLRQLSYAIKNQLKAPKAPY